MCGTSYGVAGLKKTAHGSTCVIRPWLRVNPLGRCIQEFAATTAITPTMPEITRQVTMRRKPHDASSWLRAGIPAPADNDARPLIIAASHGPHAVSRIG